MRGMRFGHAATSAALGLVVVLAMIACSGDDGTNAPASGATDGGTTDARGGERGTDAGITIDAGPPESIHYLGRFDTSDPAGARFAFPGSAIAATFQGTGVDVTLDDAGDNYFAVSIDGAAATTVHTQGGGTFGLADGLVAGQHTVSLTKMTESYQGIVQLKALTPKNGAIVPTPFPFSRRIEMIGDSITCGYGDLGKGPGCTFSADTEDETHAWGAVAAASLGAMHTAIAYSGKGMLRNYDGSTTDVMPQIWKRTFADDGTSTWDTSRYTPDVVVIDLGTNDFAKGDPTDAFVTAYEAFVAELRAAYPNAFIVCAVGTMLGGADHDTAFGYVTAVAKASNDAGDAKVSALDLGTQDANTDGIGCDSHPSVATHAKMAAKLVAHVKSLTGW